MQTVAAMQTVVHVSKRQYNPKAARVRLASPLHALLHRMAVLALAPQEAVGHGPPRCCNACPHCQEVYCHHRQDGQQRAAKAVAKPEGRAGNKKGGGGDGRQRVGCGRLGRQAGQAACS